MPFNNPPDEIVVAEGIVKAFGDRDGLYLEYDDLARDGIRTLAVRVTVVIEEPNERGYTYEKTYVYFDTSKFDVERYGHIYTDGEFERSINEMLFSLGFKGKVGYTEFGMQGDDYVSLEGDDLYIEEMLAYVRSKENENLSCNQ